MMSDFVLWVRRMSVTLAVVVLAAGVSWADEPNNQGADDPLEAPQMEDQHDGDDNPGPNPGPGTGQDTDWISIGNPPAGNPPAGNPPAGNPPANPPGPGTITVDDQGNPLVTPEPATLVLLTTGAAGTVIARWRKRSR